ncbi:hypothetical protein WSK_0298 [Novosphingobium sp. Rr 2-17]|nr:hypothetical protein WSK_0298 [Novosphingobium sp. Rr 2-17]
MAALRSSTPSTCACLEDENGKLKRLLIRGMRTL